MAGSQKNVSDIMSQTTVPASTLTPPPPSTGNNNSGAIPAPPAQKHKSVEEYTIEIPHPTAADDAQLIDDLARIVNEVYVEAEAGIWNDGFQRTSASEIEKLIRAGELAVAYYLNSSSINNGEGDWARKRQPVGCVCIKEAPSSNTTNNNTNSESKNSESKKALDAGAGVGEFGMLALDPLHRGSGLGRAMVQFVEARCRSQLGLGTVRLELVFPLDFEHAFKVRLERWYARMGYVQTCVRPFAEDFPRLAPLLRGECEYRVYEKGLLG